MRASSLLPDAQWESIAENVLWIESKGSKCIVVVMPKFAVPSSYYRNNYFELSRSLAHSNRITSLDFQSRQQHPELYQVHHWYDYNHLSYDGALFFSREIANQIAKLLTEDAE